MKIIDTVAPESGIQGTTYSLTAHISELGRKNSFDAELRFDARDFKEIIENHAASAATVALQPPQVASIQAPVYSTQATRHVPAMSVDEREIPRITRLSEQTHNSIEGEWQNQLSFRSQPSLFDPNETRRRYFTTGIPYSNIARTERANILAFDSSVPATLQRTIRGWICFSEPMPSSLKDNLEAEWSKVPVYTHTHLLNYDFGRGDDFCMSSDYSFAATFREYKPVEIPETPSRAHSSPSYVPYGDRVTTLQGDCPPSAARDLVDRLRDLSSNDFRDMMSNLRNANLRVKIDGYHLPRDLFGDAGILFLCATYDEPESFARAVESCSIDGLKNILEKLDPRAPKISERCILASLTALAGRINSGDISDSVERMQLITCIYLHLRPHDEAKKNIKILLHKVGVIAKTAWSMEGDASNDSDHSRIYGATLGGLLAGGYLFAEKKIEKADKRKEFVCDMVDAGAAMVAGGLAVTVVGLAAAILIPPLDALVKREVRKLFEGSEDLKRAFTSLRGHVMLQQYTQEVSKKSLPPQPVIDLMNAVIIAAGNS